MCARTKSQPREDQAHPRVRASYFRNADLLHRGDTPPEEKKLGGRRHSKGRDAEAIAHHYDVSNQFYRYVLGPSMAYTCAVFPTEDATLEQAQEEKFDLCLPQARLEARHATTRYRLRLGRNGHSRGEELRRRRHRCDAVEAAGRLGSTGSYRGRTRKSSAGSLQ